MVTPRRWPLASVAPRARATIAGNGPPRRRGRNRRAPYRPATRPGPRAHPAAGEGRPPGLRGLLSAGAVQGQLRAIRRERGLAAVVRQVGHRLDQRAGAALKQDLRVHGRRWIDRMPDEDEPRPRQRDRAYVAAAVPVGVAADARLTLRSIERHAPDGEIHTGRGFYVLRAVVGVEEIRAFRVHSRVERPVIGIDDP